MARMPDQINQNLYLAPELLIPNEANLKARPSERPEDRAARVAEMAASIKLNKQEYPVLVIEVDNDGATTYEYIDGGCRVEAIAKLNHDGPAGWNVWCTLVDPTEDLFRKAVTANLHRTQNSIMDMAHIVQETFERNDWKGRGAGSKVAEYLGISNSRVSEYQKVLRAPDALKKRIEAGEVGGLDAALKLMAVPEDKREKVTTRAAELAKDDQEKAQAKAAAKPAAAKKAEPKPAVTAKPPAKPKLQSKHVEQAKREEGVSTSPRAKSEVAGFFDQISLAAFPPAAVAFAEYFVKWMAGEGTDKRALALFDAATSGKKKAPKAAAKPAKKAAKKKK